MAKRPEQSLDVLGQSLLSQQASKREKTDKRRKKDQKRLAILGTLVAGQSLVNSALNRRVKEIDENNELAMQNARLYHKQIQKTAQLYDTFEGYDFANADAAYANPEFMNKIDTVYTPMFDKSMEKEYGKVPFSPSEKNNLYQKYTFNLVNNLLQNKDSWQKGLTDFGKSNKELSLGTEADTNIHLTKLAKQKAESYGGSILNIPNAKAVLSLGFKREGSAFDRSIAEQSPLQGLQGTVTALGLDKSFSEAVTNMRTSGRNWINIGANDTDTQILVENNLSLIESRLKKGDPLLKNNPNLRPFAENKLPNYNLRREQIAGGVRMGEFVGWLNDEENAFIKKQFNEYSTGLYLRLKNERGFKEELLKNIGLEPGSKEFNELRSVLDNDEDLKTFANSLVIQTSITDKEGTGRNFTVSDDDFVFDPSKLKHLLVNKIEVTRDGFTPTNDFEESTKEGKEDAIIDTKKDILNSPLDSSKKSEVFDKASEDLNNKVETSSKVIDTVVYEEAGSSINTDLTDEELADLEKIRARRKLKEDTRKAGVDQFNLLKRGATYVAFEAGDMDALNKFAETGDPNTNYRGSDRFYSALERAGLPPDATQEMVQNYLNPQTDQVTLTDNQTELFGAHLQRFNVENKDTAINNFMNVFVPAVLEIESSNNFTAKNKNSTASGGFQFLEGSVIPALNRLEKYLGPRDWGNELRQHKDASLLTPAQQTELFIADMLEKKGSDALMQKVFDGDIEGMIQAYYKLHHTKPDRDTIKRTEKIFSKYR